GEVREPPRQPPAPTQEARGTSKSMILVPLFDLKRLNKFAQIGVGTSNRRHQGSTLALPPFALAAPACRNGAVLKDALHAQDPGEHAGPPRHHDERAAVPQFDDNLRQIERQSAL